MHILHKQRCGVRRGDLAPTTDLSDQLWPATLDFWCYWGSSRESMEFTADPLQIDSPSDVILAISESLCAAALVDELAHAAGFTRGALGALSCAPSFRADVSKFRDTVDRVPPLYPCDVTAWILRRSTAPTLAMKAKVQ